MVKTYFYFSVVGVFVLVIFRMKDCNDVQYCHGINFPSFFKLIFFTLFLTELLKSKLGINYVYMMFSSQSIQYSI